MLTQRPTLQAFIEATARITLEGWQQQICSRLEALADQKGQRLLIHGPPQFGKSIIISQRLPAYLLGSHPERRIRLACYNLTHAERFSKVNLAIMRSAEFKTYFPSPDATVPSRCSAEEWSTAARADMLDANPSFKALGLGTGFTGLGVDDLIIDDPYKNREEAYSEATNAGIWGWWSDVVLPRLNPDTNVVVMFHRWWEQDFAGRLEAEGDWELLRFPAIADGEGNDPTGRAVGEILSPRYPLDYLEGIKAKQGLSFYSLYQGRPKAPEGAYLKTAWLSRFVDALPVGVKRVRYWDKAGAAEGKGDYTVGVLMARDRQGLFYIEDVVRGQWTAAPRNAQIRLTAELDRQCYGHVLTYVEQPPGLAKESTDEVIRLLAGFSVFADRVSKDKVERAEPFKAQAEAGNVRMVRAAWNTAYIQELAAFPTASHDDQVDATSGAFNMLASLPADWDAAALAALTGGRRV